MSTRRKRITPTQIERVIGVLAEVGAHDDTLNGSDRDEIGHVIFVLDRLVEAGGLTIDIGTE